MKELITSFKKLAYLVNVRFMGSFSAFRSLYQQSGSTSASIRGCGPGAVRQPTGEEREGERRRVQRIRTFPAHVA